MRVVSKPKDPEGQKHYDEAMVARAEYHSGAIDVDEAIDRVKPYCQWVKKHSLAIAKKYGKRRGINIRPTMVLR